MPYLAFDLDAKKRVPKIARAVGVETATIGWGLLELWEHAWEAKTDTVGEMALDGAFGPSPRIRDALVEFGFLEKTDAGWRVCGAEKYLKVTEARRKAAEATNLKRKATVKRRSTVRSSDAAATHERRKTDALSPNTQHPTPIDSKAIPVADAPGEPEPGPEPFALDLQDPRTDPVGEVVAHYCEALKANGFDVRPTDSKRAEVAKALKAGETVERLKEAINGLTWSDWHMGKDPKTGGKSYFGIEYAIGDTERIEANIARARSPPEPPKRAGGWR